MNKVSQQAGIRGASRCAGGAYTLQICDFMKMEAAASFLLLRIPKPQKIVDNPRHMRAFHGILHHTRECEWAYQKNNLNLIISFQIKRMIKG